MTAQREPDLRPPLLRGADKASVGLFVLGLIGYGAMIWGFLVDRPRAFHSYLTAYAFTLSVVLGSLAFVMISHAANATWPVAVRRLPEAVAPAMPLLAVLFIPVFFGIRPLYPWARINEFSPRVRELLVHRAVYMNPGLFTVRAAFFLISWSVIALLLRGLSMAMERSSQPELQARRLRHLSYAALPFMAFTVGLSAFEWLMSLSPDFSSTMFGAMWIAVCLFGGMALVVVITGLTQRSSTPLPAAGPSHYSALGRLLFAFLIFLGYTMFFQFMLIWIGNRPSEAEWFVERVHGPYLWTSLYLIVGLFFLPFFVLLSYRLKRRIEWLTWVAGWCLLSHYIHIHWLITAASHEPGYSVFDLVAFVAVVPTTISVCLWAQRGKSLAPTYDPRYVEAFSYQSR